MPRNLDSTLAAGLSKRNIQPVSRDRYSHHIGPLRHLNREEYRNAASLRSMHTLLHVLSLAAKVATGLAALFTAVAQIAVTVLSQRHDHIRGISFCDAPRYAPFTTAVQTQNGERSLNDSTEVTFALEAVTIDLCCGGHTACVADMSTCRTCGQQFCPKHDCVCPVAE